MIVPNTLPNSDFVSRHAKLLDVLSGVETSLSRSSNNEYMEVNDGQTGKPKLKSTKRFRGRESIFKVPLEPPPRFDRSQIIRSRGKRWIKYSLADVSDYALSNEGNSAAAFSFLKSLRERKEREREKEKEKEITDSESALNEKHLFKITRDATNKNDSVDNDEKTVTKSVFRSSKLVMPEYVVGQTKKIRKNLQRNSTSDKHKEIYLDHIHTYEDE